MDRQHIRRRIAKLRRDIRDLARTRALKRSQRESSGVPQIAIAGYTNAGKSTLMNSLTDARVLVADQLFATLDPTVRRIALPNGRKATLSDTVGFVSKLPHDLVESFRSTLEEVTLASLVLHVADASAPELDRQIQAVREVLAEIGAGGIPEVLALNKVDLLTDSDRARLSRRHAEGVQVSAQTGEGTEALLEAVASAVPAPPVDVTLLVPFDREDVVARLYREAEVLGREPDNNGTVVRARVGERQLAWAKEFLLRPARVG